MAGHELWFLPSSCFVSLWIYVIPFILLAYTVSSTFRFYIKCLCLMVYYFIMSSLIIVMSFWAPGSKNNIHKATRFFGWIPKIWGIKYNVKGLENYRKDSNYIIVSNHQSSFDMNVVANFMPPNTTFLAKRDALYVPFIGLMFWICGVFFVDRQRHSEAINTMKKAAEQIRREKFNLWIFPEGTRHMGNKLLPFKKGAFHLAQQIQIPVLPVVVSSYEHIVNFGQRRFTTGTIDITILPEVSTEGLESSDVEELTEKVYSRMCKEYEKCADNQK